MSQISGFLTTDPFHFHHIFSDNIQKTQSTNKFNKKIKRETNYP